MAEETKVLTVTEEGLKKLQDDLAYLVNVKRPEVTKNIGIARGFGDLSENSEYDEAKNEQAKVEAAIAELEEQLKHVRVVAEVNTELEDSPEMLNEDPYGAWIFKVENITAFEELLDAEAYEAMTKEG